MKEYAELIVPDLVRNQIIGKIFKNEIFNSDTQIRFPEKFRSVEDMGIFPLILKRISRAVITEKALYFYRWHMGNVTNRTAQTIVNPLERALCFMERYATARDLAPDTMPIILKKAVWFGISTYSWFNRENAAKYADEYQAIRNFFAEYKHDILTSPLIDKSRKIAAKLIISGWTVPFRILSKCRPWIKKLINKFDD